MFCPSDLDIPQKSGDILLSFPLIPWCHVLAMRETKCLHREPSFVLVLTKVLKAFVSASADWFVNAS
jgi:hypothetical protein